MNQKSFQFLVQGGEKEIYEGVEKIPWYFFFPFSPLAMGEGIGMESVQQNM